MSEDKVNPYLKYFVKESQPKIHHQFDNSDINCSEEYEQVIATTESRKTKYREKHRLRKRKMCKAFSKTKNDEPIDTNNIPDINDLFKAITHENVEFIERLLRDSNFDINTRDNYLWTPLMCACHRGDAAIVELLLNRGASIKVHDMAGNGPLSIAKQCNYLDICKLVQKRLNEQISHEKNQQNSEQIPITSESCARNTIVNEFEEKKKTDAHRGDTKYTNREDCVQSKISQSSSSACGSSTQDGTSSNNQRDIKSKESKDPEVIDIISSDSDEEMSIYCELCSMQVNENNHKEHLLSTVHQFYKQLKGNDNNKLVKPVDYGIPEQNPGFQLLLKSGWTKQSGLGKHQSGIRAPIKTKIKNDRKGIGKKIGKMHSILPELNLKFNPALRKDIEKKKELLYRNELNGT